MTGVRGGARVYGVGARVYGVRARVYGVKARVYDRHSWILAMNKMSLEVAQLAGLLVYMAM